MVMLQPVVQGTPPTLTSYTYRAGGTNADFVAGRTAASTIPVRVCSVRPI